MLPVKLFIGAISYGLLLHLDLAEAHGKYFLVLFYHNKSFFSKTPCNIFGIYPFFIS